MCSFWPQGIPLLYISHPARDERVLYTVPSLSGLLPSVATEKLRPAVGQNVAGRRSEGRRFEIPLLFLPIFC